VEKKRNPQDTTLRNIRALKTRVTALEQDVKMLKQALKEALQMALKVRS
jgi:hypothetical protein